MGFNACKSITARKSPNSGNYILVTVSSSTQMAQMSTEQGVSIVLTAIRHSN